MSLCCWFFFFLTPLALPLSSSLSPTISVPSASHCNTRNEAIVRVGHFAQLSAALLLHPRGKKKRLENPAGCMQDGTQTGFTDSAVVPSL